MMLIPFMGAINYTGLPEERRRIGYIIVQPTRQFRLRLRLLSATLRILGWICSRSRLVTIVVFVAPPEKDA